MADVRTIVSVPLSAAARTDPGRMRANNEDLPLLDAARGVFGVIDGIGGLAGGEVAAATARDVILQRLARPSGTHADRVREAIAIANNEIYKRATGSSELDGMGCVITLAIVADGRLTIGHVGDTRLYKLRDDRIDKITRDHSPVGEREDSNELSELEAMHHPRRNEVYRDVGSDPHQPDDPDFIDVREIPFEPDAALLLCSDGLTDLIDSSAMHDVVDRFAGQPDHVVKELIDAANAAGGKDNISVVYVEGERFASGNGRPGRAAAEITRRLGTNAAAERPAVVDARRSRKPPRGRRAAAPRGVTLAVIALLAGVIAVAVVRLWPYATLFERRAIAPPAAQAGTITVGPLESIAAALQRADPGSVVLVEPGEYRETLTLKDNVRVVSRVPREATIRLSGTASEADAAVVAASVTGAELAGFRIVGDAATPLGTGVLVRGSDVSLVDIEVTGAVNTAISIDGTSVATLLASDVHDNPGAALTIRSASARIAHNVFMRNGMSERVRRSFIIDEGADPRFSGNIFHGVSRDAFGDLSDASRAALARDNWFAEAQDPRSPSSTTPRIRRGR